MKLHALRPGPWSLGPSWPSVALVAVVLIASMFVTASAALAGQAESSTHVIDVAQWRATDVGTALTIERFPLPGGAIVDLRLERFRVTTDRTVFVVGNVGGDRPLEFDPDRVVLLRGQVVGEPASHVFLASTRRGGFGTISLAGRRYDMSPVGPRSAGGTSGVVRITSRAVAGGRPPGIPMCGLDTLGAPPRLRIEAASAGGAGGEGGAALQTPADSMMVIELAVETDYEFYQLFGNLQDAADYVIVNYAGCTDITMRDVNSRFELSFVRLWDDSDDLFNIGGPLSAFRQYWNENMDHVDRDVAQFFSGRRDFPYGGAAYLSALCGSAGYSVVGYALGFKTDDERPNPFTYDIHVTAHELGHNMGALHTHDYGLDTCNLLDGDPQRGSIMSYCSQTVSGGGANTDLRFHARVQEFIVAQIRSLHCPHVDCNGNGIDDLVDLLDGASADTNFNLVPDECEDCNGNGVLDGSDVLQGTSLDLNFNGIPDECEPDCNENGIPDDKDIESGASHDRYGNGIPDECEMDCDGDGGSDYTQLQHDMSLDVNRNTVLDSCEDCDGDGVIDRDELAGAHNAWVASATENALREFHAVSGVLMTVSEVDRFVGAQDVLIDQMGRIFVSSGLDHRVVEFDRSGAYVGDFVSAGAGGLDYPSGLVLKGDGNMLVGSGLGHAVLEYDGSDGSFVGVFVAPGDGGLEKPFGMAIGPNGNLFVTSDEEQVLEFDGTTGAFVGVFVSVDDNGGLGEARGIAFKPDGNLLVCSQRTNQVLEYDARTGAFVRQFNDGGTEVALTLDRPWSVRVGPDGVVYVSRSGVQEAESPPFLQDPQLHVNSSRMYAFDAISGIFLRSYVLGNDTGLWQPTAFAFFPGARVDCNLNNIPDECDIASGRSADKDGDGVPDECACAADLDGDGHVGLTDLLAIMAAWGPCVECPEDLDGDDAVGFTDMVFMLASWGPCVSIR